MRISVCNRQCITYNSKLFLYSYLPNLEAGKVITHWILLLSLSFSDRFSSTLEAKSSTLLRSKPFSLFLLNKNQKQKGKKKMSSGICRSAARAARTILAASSKQSSRAFSGNHLLSVNDCASYFYFFPEMGFLIWCYLDHKEK